MSTTLVSRMGTDGIVRPVNGEDRGPCTLTYTGGYFYLKDPRPEEIKLLDIAHHLSRQCRYAGVVPHHYSVAQHSVLCSWIAEDLGFAEHEIKQAFGHDMSEAYLIDVPRPVKLLWPEYYSIEMPIQRCIAGKYGFEAEMYPSIKEIDNRILHTEARDLDLKFNMEWGDDDKGPYSPDMIRIIPTSAEYARDLFIRRFCELFGYHEDDVYAGAV